MANSPSRHPGGSPQYLTLLLLGVVILAAVALRIPGISWLVGIGPTPDFSFMLDDQRFVELARDFKAGMPDGYVYGMTTQLLALRAAIVGFWSEPNSLQLLRVITVFHAGLTVMLTYILARDFSVSRGFALIAAFMAATAPLHMAISNYGTADVSAISFFYMTVLVSIRYLRERDQLWFVVAALLTGAAIAVKLFVPLVLPLAMLVLLHKGRALIAQALTAILVAAAGFEALSFFAYAPWDLAQLLAVLHQDVVSIAGGNNFAKQVVLYAWDLPSAVSLPTAALFLAGLYFWALRAARLFASRSRAREPLDLGARILNWRDAITPATLLLAPLLFHGLLIVSAGVHAIRHLSVVVPAVCVAAAYWLMVAFARMKPGLITRVASIGLLVAYGTANAIAVEALYTHDTRYALAARVARHVDSGKTVISLNDWSRVAGTVYDRHADPRALPRDTYLVTCDLEFNGYLRSPDATTYGAYGGQERTDFFWSLFQGKSNYRVVEILNQPPLSLEQKLIDLQILRPFGTFIPKNCLVLAQASAEQSLDISHLWPRLYFTSGW